MHVDDLGAATAVHEGQIDLDSGVAVVAAAQAVGWHRAGVHGGQVEVLDALRVEVLVVAAPH